MALPGSGSISLNQINTELGKPSGSPISLGSASTGGYGTLSSYSPSKPDGAAPHRISEFYNYNHAATPPSITITGYNSGYIYFTLSGTGYSPSVLTVKRSTSSASGPWTSDTAGPTSPRSVPVPTVTTWYMIEDAINTSIFSNVYQLVIANDTTPPSVPAWIDCYYGPGSPQSSIYIEWESSTDNVSVTGYQLQRKTASGSTYATIYSGPNTSYVDSGSQNTTYNYRARAFDAAGNYSNYTAVTTWTTDPIKCFVEGTLITLPDGSQKTIEKLKINDLLLSAEIKTLNDTNEVAKLYKWSCDYLAENRIIAPITNIEPKIAYKTIILNNGLLEATPFHSQLIQREGIWKFIPIGEVVVGDKLYGLSKEIIPITSVSVNFEERKIYPLTLSPSHTYFANGVLTHNIKPPDPV